MMSSPSSASFLRRAVMSSVSFSVVLFAAAGRLDYGPGWLYAAVSLASALANSMTMKNDDALMNERMKPGEGMKAWDRSLLAGMALVSVATLVVAGLDSGRWRMTPDVPWGLRGCGVALMAAGQAVFFLARRENRFFSTVVRIQRERGHTVCASGPYAVIRHPGYLGMIVSTLGLPLILGSLWSTVPTAVSVILLCVRTSREDGTLRNELEGYAEYTGKVRSMLVPRLW